MAGDEVAINVDALEKSLLFVPKVEKSFRRGNENYYTPKIVSIGPYHREKSHLQGMETSKVKFLDDLLSRSKPPKTFENCKQEVSKKGKERRARKCYQGINKDPTEDDGFLEMMVRDAGFIIELFMKERGGEKVGRFHSVYPLIKRDMLLLENQVPFFVLRRLFKFVFGKDFTPALDELAIDFFEWPVKKGDHHKLPLGSVNHLLHLHHSLFCPEACSEPESSAISLIPCATTLDLMGVTFTKASEESKLIDVNFSTEDKTLKVPQLSVSEDKVSLLFNLVVLEQSNGRLGSHFTSYAVFMNNMLSKAEDVDLLCKKEIIVHRLVNHEEVVNIFATMCSGAFIHLSSNSLSGVLGAIKSYSETPQAIRLKTIREGKPWYFIFYKDYVGIGLVLLGGLGLWVFTLVQTVFTVLSYYHTS